MLPILLVLTLLAGLMVGTGTASAAEGSSIHLKLTIDSVEEGTLKMSVSWSAAISTSTITYSSWDAFTASIVADLGTAGTTSDIIALGDALASQATAAEAANLILAPENRGFASVEASRLALYDDHLVVQLDYTFNSTTRVKLRPLAFVDDLLFGDTFTNTMSAIGSEEVHLTTSHFLLSHIRTHEGERIGGSGQGMSYLDTPLTPYNTTSDSLSIEAAESPFTPILMAGMFLVFVILVLVFMKLMGKEGLGGFCYALLALVFFVFVSLPLANYIFLALLLIGLLRQILKLRTYRKFSTIKTEIKHDMLSPLKDDAKAEEKETLGELDGSGNIMARLFPFKIKELFMIYNDGRLISHATLKVGGTVDSQIVSTMLTAIQDFISDSFKTGEEEALENIKYGKIHLFIQRGKHIYVAAVIDGTAPDTFSGELKELVTELEDDYRSLLVDWDGETTKLKPAQGDMQKFIKYWSKS